MCLEVNDSLNFFNILIEGRCSSWNVCHVRITDINVEVQNEGSDVGGPASDPGCAVSTSLTVPCHFGKFIYHPQVSIALSLERG